MHILFVHIYYYNEFSSEPGVSHARLRSNFFIKKKSTINHQREKTAISAVKKHETTYMPCGPLSEFVAQQTVTIRC